MKTVFGALAVTPTRGFVFCIPLLIKSTARRRLRSSVGVAVPKAVSASRRPLPIEVAPAGAIVSRFSSVKTAAFVAKSLSLAGSFVHH